MISDASNVAMKNAFKSVRRWWSSITSIGGRENHLRMMPKARNTAMGYGMKGKPGAASQIERHCSPAIEHAYSLPNAERFDYTFWFRHRGVIIKAARHTIRHNIAIIEARQPEIIGGFIYRKCHEMQIYRNDTSPTEIAIILVQTRSLRYEIISVFIMLGEATYCTLWRLSCFSK